VFFKRFQNPDMGQTASRTATKRQSHLGAPEDAFPAFHAPASPLPRFSNNETPSVYTMESLFKDARRKQVSPFLQNQGLMKPSMIS
jgi:hypothetical protein